MSATTSETPKLNLEEAKAVQTAAAKAREIAMTIGRPITPALTPLQAGQPGEATTMLLVHKEILLTLQTGGKVAFKIGLQPVPDSLAGHWFVKAAQFKRFGKGPDVGQEPDPGPHVPDGPAAAPTLEEGMMMAQQLGEQSQALADLNAANADLAAKLAEAEAKIAAADAAAAARAEAQADASADKAPAASDAVATDTAKGDGNGAGKAKK